MPLTVRITKDFPYLRSYMARKGMWRAATGNAYRIEDPEKLFNGVHNVFFEVREDSDPPEKSGRGWIAFCGLAPHIYAMHTMLTTLGQRSIDAMNISIRKMRKRGATKLIAFFPTSHKAAEQITRRIGFQDDLIFPVINPLPATEPYKFRYLNL